MFFLGFIICSPSNAKVLPIIEGSEILDSLASQNSEEHNMPELNAGIYKYVDFEYMINPHSNFLKEKLYSMDKRFYSYSFITDSVYPILYPKSDNKLIFTEHIHTQH